MFNLLPENLRKNIITDYRLRLTILSLLFVVLIQVCFLIFLFPTWLTSNYKEKDYLIRSEEMNTFLSTLDLASTTSNVKNLNNKLSTINENLSYPLSLPIINNILSKKTTNIKISGIYYTINSKNSGLVTVNGVSDKRDSLVLFAENLRSIPEFKKVDLPISNLAKDKNIEFTININIEN